MNDDNKNSGGDGFKTRKRKMAEVEEDEEVVGGLRWRSGGGTSHEWRWGMGMSPDSRIVRVSRSSGGKDRHSKVLTAKGLRDRRVRLSVSTAIQFYDLQDRLALDQPSKAVEWLLKAAAPAINDLPQLVGTFPNDLNTEQGGGLGIAFTETPSTLGMSTSQSSREGQQGHCEMLKMMMMRQQAADSASASALGKSSTSTNSNSGGEEGEGPGVTSLSRSEWRVKARARARERAKTNFQPCANPAAIYSPGDNDGAGARDTFTGLLNSVGDIALEARESNHNSKRPCAGLSVQPYHPHGPDHHLFHDPTGHTSHQPYPPAFVNAAIFTCQDHKHHTDHLSVSSHFTSNPTVLQQQNKASFNVEEQHLVPINFSWPVLSGRETLQSNPYNNIMAFYTQTNHSVDQPSMVTAARRREEDPSKPPQLIAYDIKEQEKMDTSRWSFK
ncbi:hypothetical protein SUGI_1151730 [Cryptomeria japonica]|nr:hypothetical protein SUGI_1151730 [Cryptomeria japonica]